MLDEMVCLLKFYRDSVVKPRVYCTVGELAFFDLILENIETADVLGLLIFYRDDVVTPRRDCKTGDLELLRLMIEKAEKIENKS
jgi:hypothetical protein